MATSETAAMMPDHPHRLRFVPTADAAILTSKHPLPPTRPAAVGPIFDPRNLNHPIDLWSSEVQTTFYPKTEAYDPAAIPPKPPGFGDRYLRAFLADNERLRLSMLWYYSRDILKQDEFLSGLQEKVHLAQEFTGWEFAVIGILDVNVYIRLATVGLELGVLPRGETICAHTVTQPPGSVFLMPNLMEDWRFQKSPYLELGGLRAYAGVPLRLQNQFGDCVSLGSLCVASSKSEDPLTKTQHQALVRLADWVVSDMVQCARARRQRERRKMTELLSQAQQATEGTVSEEPVMEILAAMYPDAMVTIQSDTADHVKVKGHDPIPLSDFDNNLWEDTDYLNDFITTSNHLPPPSTRVVRIIAAPCEVLSGSSLLLVASNDYKFVFDDVDLWFVQACAGMISQMWRKRLLIEAMTAKEKFLRGFSHQLRTPIHGILGSVDLLTEEMKSGGIGVGAVPLSPLLTKSPAVDSEKLSSYLSIIKMAGRDLTSIVNNMITLNRWTDIAINDRHHAMHTVHELEAEIESEIRKFMSGDTRYKTSIFIYHDVPPDCASFRTDLAVLCSSLLPLIVNAIQNTPEGTMTINILVDPTEGQVIVDIQDNGRGIHPDDQQRIFEPYEKVDTQAPGAGLGLTLASRFSTLINGSVKLISSDPDHGSHFRATFQGIECACSPMASDSLSKKFDNLPSRFSTIKTGSDCVSLCENFVKLLTQHGFTASDSREDCIVLAAVSNPTEYRQHLSHIPSSQLVICLASPSDDTTSFESSPKNVLYISGLFSMSTFGPLLEKAQQWLVDMTTSKQPSLDGGQPLAAQPEQADDACVHTSPLHVSTTLSGPITANQTLPGICQPLAEVSISSYPKATDPPNVPDSCRPTVLIVDDNAVNLRIMEMYCRKRGLPYHSAVDGLQAVELFSRQQSLSAQGEAAGIQLIFMDLQMPLCDGIEATRQIRSLEQKHGWQRSFVIVMTGQDTTTDRVAAKAVDTDEYFVKPVVIKTLDQLMVEHFPGFKTNKA